MMIAYIDLSLFNRFNLLLVNDLADDIVNQVLSEVDSPFNKTDLVIAPSVERNLCHIEKIIDKIIDYDFNKVILIIDYNNRKTYTQDLSDRILEKCEIILMNFMSFYSIRYLEKRHPQHSSWNWYNKKGYFPTGTLNRPNRVGFLKRLYDSDLLDDMIWTFPNADRQKSSIIKYFIDNFGEVPINFEEFLNYSTEHAFSADTPIYDRHYDRYPMNSFLPFDCDEIPTSQYKLSNFTILSETYDDAVTEKTYMVILHRHPFIMLGNGSRTLFDNLKELGFKTFNEYLPHSDYANIEDLELRWDQTIENIKVFPTILQNRKEEISADIEYNYNLCLNLGLQTINKFNKISSDLTEFLRRVDEPFSDNKRFIDKFGVDLYNKYKEREKILLENKSQKEFIEKYNIIKAENWPEIYNKNDFYSLPDWIKEECKTVFKLQ